MKETIFVATSLLLVSTIVILIIEILITIELKKMRRAK